MGQRNYFNKGHHLLEELGFDEYAYDYLDINSVFDYIQEQQDVVVGGDIYTNENGHFIFQYHGWSYSQKNFKTDSENSINIAREYIQKCVQWHGENFYVVPVVSKGLYKSNKIC